MTRRNWIALAAGSMATLASRASAQSAPLPLKTTALDHVSITVPDAKAAAEWYGKIFDPQIWHEQTGVQRFYVRLGQAYLAFGPQANVAAPFADHIAVGIVDFNEQTGLAPIAAALGLPGGRGNLPMVADPDQYRLQLVNATHGIFDTIISAGRVIPDAAALVPESLDHITMAVTDLDKSAAHYAKLFGAPASREKSPARVWFQVGTTRLGLEPVKAGQKPGVDHFCVRVAGFDRNEATARLKKLGVTIETNYPNPEKGVVRFRDLHNLVVEVTGA